MQLGIFAKTFVRPTVEQVFKAVASHGLRCVQFNMACAGLPSMPDKIEPGVCERIRNAAAENDVSIAAVSGTFNMIHPDTQQRRQGLRRLAVLAEACDGIGASVITLCTGSRDAKNMWRRHPDNDSNEAWEDLLSSLREALRIAEDSQVTLACEPESANVIDSALKARRLLDNMRSSRLKVVLDAANLIQVTNVEQMDRVLQEAAKLLGPDVVIAHAKDVTQVHEQMQFVAAGNGQLNYELYLQLLRDMNFSGPLVLHELAESEVDRCVAFLRNKM